MKDGESSVVVNSIMVSIIFLFFFSLFYFILLLILFYLTLQYCIGFAIYQNESATGIHIIFLHEATSN